jgi:hypothetical protein
MLPTTELENSIIETTAEVHQMPITIIRQANMSLEGKVQFEVEQGGVRSIMTIRQIIQVMR